MRLLALVATLASATNSSELKSLVTARLARSADATAEPDPSVKDECWYDKERWREGSLRTCMTKSKCVRPKGDWMLAGEGMEVCQDKYFRPEKRPWDYEGLYNGSPIRFLGLCGFDSLELRVDHDLKIDKSCACGPMRTGIRNCPQGVGADSCKFGDSDEWRFQLCLCEGCNTPSSGDGWKSLE